MLGYCGIDCSGCSAYRATITPDAKLMQHVQDTFGKGTGTLKDWVCLGCLYPEPALIATYCASCEIRRCALERDVANCAVCPTFENCEKLHPFIEEEDEALALRMNWLREAFLDRTKDGPSG